MRSPRYNNLDWLRIFLATEVLVGHTLNWLKTSFTWPIEPVSAFVSISGFVILPSVQRWAPSEFIVRRLARVMPAFFASLCLGLALSGPESVGSSLRAYFTFGLIHEPTANLPLWSLAVEESLYGAMVVLCLAGALKGGRFAPICYVIALAVCFQVIDVKDPELRVALLRATQVAPCFFLGALFEAKRERLKQAPAWLFALLVGIAVATRPGTPWIHWLSALGGDRAALGYQMFWCQIGGLGALGLALRLRQRELPKWLPDISYGVYIYHAPLMIGLGTWFGGLAFPIAYVSRRWLEEPTMRLGATFRARSRKARAGSNTSDTSSKSETCPPSSPTDPAASTT